MGKEIKSNTKPTKQKNVRTPVTNFAYTTSATTYNGNQTDQVEGNTLKNKIPIAKEVELSKYLPTLGIRELLDLEKASSMIAHKTEQEYLAYANQYPSEAVSGTYTLENMSKTAMKYNTLHNKIIEEITKRLDIFII